MKHAVVIFSKVPRAGVSKTRLTLKRGGILTEEEANEFYEAFLADVIHACAGAAPDLYLCHDAAGDANYLDQYLKCISAPPELKIYCDNGGAFDQCMQFGADYIIKNGTADRLADTVTIVSGDLPSLQRSVILDGLKKLEKLSAMPEGLAAARNIPSAKGIGAAVIKGACQKGGFSIIGFTCTTPFDFNGVFDNKGGITALDMIVEKCADNKIPIGIVNQMQDVDVPQDLASMVPNIMALELAGKTDRSVSVPYYTINFIRKIRLMSIATALGS